MRVSSRPALRVFVTWTTLIALLALLILVWIKPAIPLWVKMLVLLLIMVLTPSWKDLSSSDRAGAERETGRRRATDHNDSTANCDDMSREE
jgi:uncharacterized protein (DUF58 family)